MLKKSDVEALKLEASVQNEILALLDKAETAESNIAALQAKLPKDTQKVVESVDYDEWQKQTAELKRLKEEIAAKLPDDAGDEEKNGFLAWLSL